MKKITPASANLDLLEGIIREGVERGQFKIADQRPRDVATQIAASVQGALLMARITSDSHVLDEVVLGLRRYLGYAPQGTPQASEITSRAI